MASAPATSQLPSRSSCTPPNLTPSGASATSHQSAISSERKMTDMRGLPDDSDMGPNPNYQPNHAAQYPQPTYSYARGPDNFGVDQDMNLVQNYAQEISPHMNQMDSAMQESNGHVQGHNMSISTANVPGMAPPRTPQTQSFSSPTNARPSIDGSQDLTNTGDGSKRKRSKVSRACDECRRKKIRCDAADDEGNIKTCTNCARAGQTCDYSRIPMKRGPSKGYIKELSERVQQVESQMAMSGGSQGGGYRQSLDGNMSIYPESSYSPDEPMSLKRNFSFSEARSNPFAQPQFNRDRMPSTGGWSSTSAPRPRDRGSVAVAPDQLPEVLMSNGGQSAVKFSKPFWSQDDGPPAKRQKVTEDESNVAAMADSVLSRQLEAAKFVLPIFPDTNATLAAVKAAPPRLQHAISFALGLVVRNARSEDNAFQDYGAVEAYVGDNARVSPEVRSREENTTWMLLYLAMIINADQDLARFRGGEATTLSKVLLLKFAMDLGKYLKESVIAAESGSDNALIRKAANFTCLLDRLHCISAGIEDALPVGSIDSSVLVDTPPPTGLLVRAAELFSVTIMTIQNTLMYSQSNQGDFGLRKLIEKHLEFLKVSAAPLDSRTEHTAKILSLFIEILLSRYYSRFHPLEILMPAVELTTSLGSSAQADNTWNPLTVHLYTLTAITLLEFTDIADPEMASQAYTSLGVLLTALDSYSYEGGAEYPGLYWADGLKSMIVAKTGRQNMPTTETGINETRNGDDHAQAQPTTTTAPPVAVGESTSTQQAENGEPTTTTAAGDAATAENGAGAAAPDPATATDAATATAPAPAPAPAPSLLAAEINTVPLDPTTLPPLAGDRILLDPKAGTVQFVDFRLLLRHGFGNVLAERNGY